MASHPADPFARLILWVMGLMGKLVVGDPIVYRRGDELRREDVRRGGRP